MQDVCIVTVRDAGVRVHQHIHSGRGEVRAAQTTLPVGGQIMNVATLQAGGRCALTLVLTIALGPALAWADSVVFETDTHIADGDLTYDGDDVTVRGCVLTVDGQHAFASLTVEHNTTGDPG
jgi:hypothetical protein